MKLPTVYLYNSIYPDEQSVWPTEHRRSTVNAGEMMEGGRGGLCIMYIQPGHRDGLKTFLAR